MPRIRTVIAVVVLSCVAGCVPQWAGSGVRLDRRRRGVPAAAVPFTPGTADPARKAALLEAAPRLDELFRARVGDGEGRATGAAVGIVLEGASWSTRAGSAFATVETKTPIDLDSVFCIASMTKSFTAAAVMKLRGRGQGGSGCAGRDVRAELAALIAPTATARAERATCSTHASGLPYDDAWGKGNTSAPASTTR